MPNDLEKILQICTLHDWDFYVTELRSQNTRNMDICEHDFK